MQPGKVYFTDMRCKVGESLLQKMERLITKAGIDQIDFERKFTAIKLHFGEPGNLSFLRPGFAKVVADHVKKQGGLPFLTDCNTLYVGRRKHGLEHMDAAMENGFSPMSTGCQIIIADGLKGTDDVEVPVPGGVYCKTARVGRALMDADVLISLTHYKGHEQTGMGGAMKNIGMGGGSRAGKQQMHREGKLEVDQSLCRSCGACIKFCAHGAISYAASDRKASIDPAKCVGCGRCMASCNFDAIDNPNTTSPSMLCARIAEYTQGIVYGRPAFHISVVNQVSPNCDCHSENDAAVVPDIGIFASFDPVALDAACSDAVNAATPIPGTWLSESGSGFADHLTAMHPETNWRAGLIHAEKIGLGCAEYELITMN